MPRRDNDFRSLKEKFTSFTWSYPYGYDFSEVEETFKEYRSTISDMNELLIKKDEECSALKARCDDYVKTITEMQINYESLNVPEYSQEQSIEILDNFKNSESMSVPIERAPVNDTSQQHHRRDVRKELRNEPVQQERDHSSYDIENQNDGAVDNVVDTKQRRVKEDVMKRIIEDVDPYVVSDSSGIIT